MRTLTDFGDLAVLLPLTAVILIWLVSAASARDGVRWFIAVLLCAGGIALLKVYFFACPVSSELASPSGHAGFSTLVFGTLAVVVAAKLKTGWWQMAVAGGAGALVVSIAISRFTLGAHSPLEVILGMIVGLAALGVFALGYLRGPRATGSLTPFLVAVVVVLAVLHGQELHADELLHAISLYVHGVTACA